MLGCEAAALRLRIIAFFHAGIAASLASSSSSPSKDLLFSEMTVAGPFSFGLNDTPFEGGGLALKLSEEFGVETDL